MHILSAALSALSASPTAGLLLAGELAAALALGTPRPVEAELLDAVDPLRFALRRARRAIAAV